MKPHFPKSAGRLRVKSWAFLLGLILFAFAAQATQSLYSNSGTINNNNLPNVDATNFYNSGSWNIATVAPYQTANTLNYTNVGTMTGAVGWEFDFGSTTIPHSYYGGPYLSANFVNTGGGNNNNGTIEADDLTVANYYGNYPVSYLLVLATNIVNTGTLIAGPHGLMVLSGVNVTISRSTLEITPVAAQGSSNVGTNFTSDVQVESMYWVTNYMGLDSVALWNGTNVFNGTNITSGGRPIPFPFSVNGNVFNVSSYSALYANLYTNSGTVNNDNASCGVLNFPVQMVPFTAYTFTNITPAVTNLGVVTPAVTNIEGSDSISIVAVVTNLVCTNSSGGPFTVTNLPVQIIRQAVFLNINPNSGIVGQVRFSPSPIPTNFGQTVAVRLTATLSNVLTHTPLTSSIYLVDTLLSETNFGIIYDTNRNSYYSCPGAPGRPANFIMSRLDSGNNFLIGSPGNGVPPNNFFYSIIGPPGIVVPQPNVLYSTNLASQFVAADDTADAAYIDNQTSDQQSGVMPPNLGGRIMINANNLNLSKANLVGGGYIAVQASNLVSSAGALVNCQYLSFDLGSTNGLLNVTNLASQSIFALQGNVAAWSAVWTNNTFQIIANYAATTSTNNVNVYVPANITNTTVITYYVLVVDASELSEQVPVTVQNLTLHSTNIVVSDSMTVENSLLLEGTSFTLLGELDLSSTIADWTSAIAPNLLYFTNNGYLSIPDDAHFGDDTTVPYKEFVNNGTGGTGASLSGIIVAADQTIDSFDLQITEGINYTTTGDFSATAQSMEITGTPSFSSSFPAIDSANNINLFANTVLFDATVLSANGALNFTVTNSLSDFNTACSFTCYGGFNLWIKPQTGDLLYSTITSTIVGDAEIGHAWAGIDYGPSLAGFTNNVAIGTLVLSAQNPSEGPLFHFYGTGGSSSNAMYVKILDLSQLGANAADLASMIQIDPGMKIYVSAVNLGQGFTLPPGQTLEEFLAANVPGVVAVPNPPVSVAIDAQANVHAISPMIYGVAFATSEQLSDLNFTMNRSGGNNETRYNWLQNAHNHDADYFFESIPDEFGTGLPVASGATADNFVSNSISGGAQPMITIPMIGWMPNVITNGSRATAWSYSIEKYGPQTDSDTNNGIYSIPDAGNGISVTNDTPITWNNPNDANFPTNVNFQRGYVKHLINKWGASTNGGVRYYLMDNEHSLWYSTHQDVHPIGPTMQEIWTNMLTYATMVKSNDPNALVLGPEEWGWNGYLYSGYDQQWFNTLKNYNPLDFPDRQNNGGWDYMPWLLNHFQQYQNTNASHQRLLDYFTLHCYPQEGNVSSQSAVDNATELLRNQSTRVFWDTNYVDPSWINTNIMLIPRMKTWVATNYPGTKIGITEYNWGAEPYINGATAQADILGIFGSQGLDLATRWEVPATNTPTYLAMKMYRNYDGNKSTFGNNSVAVTVPDPDNLSAFAAIRTNDNALTIMVVNKAVGMTPVSLNIANFGSSGIAQAWQLTAANVITQLPNLTLTNGVLSDMLPSQSVTLFVLSSAAPFNLQAGTSHPPGYLQFQLNGQSGQSYILLSSTNLITWSPVSTNTLSGSSITFQIPTTNKSRMFYRGLFNPP